MSNAEVLELMLYGCVTWSPRSCHYDALIRAHHNFLTRRIGWRKHKRTDHPISYAKTLLKKTGSGGIEATLRKRRILFAGLWRVWRTQDYRNARCSENSWEGQFPRGGRKRSGWGASWTTSEL